MLRPTCTLLQLYRLHVHLLHPQKFFYGEAPILKIALKIRAFSDRFETRQPLAEVSFTKGSAARHPIIIYTMVGTALGTSCAAHLSSVAMSSPYMLGRASTLCRAHVSLSSLPCQKNDRPQTTLYRKNKRPRRNYRSLSFFSIITRT